MPCFGDMSHGVLLFAIVMWHAQWSARNWAHGSREAFKWLWLLLGSQYLQQMLRMGTHKHVAPAFDLRFPCGTLIQHDSTIDWERNALFKTSSHLTAACPLVNLYISIEVTIFPEYINHKLSCSISMLNYHGVSPQIIKFPNLLSFCRPQHLLVVSCLLFVLRVLCCENCRSFPRVRVHCGTWRPEVMQNVRTQPWAWGILKKRSKFNPNSQKITSPFF